MLNATSQHSPAAAEASARVSLWLALFLGVDETIVHRVPTAGLEPGQSDFKDLGYDYDVVELVTEGLQQGFTEEQLAAHEQVAPLVKTQIALYRSQYGGALLDTVEKVVADIIRRHKSAMGKVKIVHPPTPQISLRYA